MQQYAGFYCCKITIHISTASVASGHAGDRLLLWHVICPIPEAAVTVCCTPDDGCVRHPKYVE
jgi:hypothetical protein